MPKYYVKSRHGGTELVVDRGTIREALTAYELRMGQNMVDSDMFERDSVMVSEIGFGQKECGEYNVTIRP